METPWSYNSASPCSMEFYSYFFRSSLSGFCQHWPTRKLISYMKWSGRQRCKVSPRFATLHKWRLLKTIQNIFFTKSDSDKVFCCYITFFTVIFSMNHTSIKIDWLLDIFILKLYATKWRDLVFDGTRNCNKTHQQI